MQVVEPLPGGGSLKLTVAKYFTPSGRCIQAVAYAGGRLEASAAVSPAAAPAVPAVPAAAPVDASDPVDSSAAAPPATSTTPSASPMPLGPSEPLSRAGGSRGSPESSRALSRPPSSFSRQAREAALGARTPKPDSPGALLRLDPSDSSLPGAAADAGQTYTSLHGRTVGARDTQRRRRPRALPPVHHAPRPRPPNRSRAAAASRPM